MTLLLTDTVISTFKGGVPGLIGALAMMTRPGPMDQAPFGGIIRYVLLLNPGSDVAPGDQLSIISWGQHTVDSTKRYQVFSAPLTGGLGLECIRCVVGDRVER